MSPEAGDDTEPATDTEEAVVVGTKRKAKGAVGSTSKYVLVYSHPTSVLTVRRQGEAITRGLSVRILVNGSPPCHRTRR